MLLPSYAARSAIGGRLGPKAPTPAAMITARAFTRVPDAVASTKPPSAGPSIVFILFASLENRVYRPAPSPRPFTHPAGPLQRLSRNCVIPFFADRTPPVAP